MMTRRRFGCTPDASGEIPTSVERGLWKLWETRSVFQAAVGARPAFGWASTAASASMAPQAPLLIAIGESHYRVQDDALSEFTRTLTIHAER